MGYIPIKEFGFYHSKYREILRSKEKSRTIILAAQSARCSQVFRSKEENV